MNAEGFVSGEIMKYKSGEITNWISMMIKEQCLQFYLKAQCKRSLTAFHSEHQQTLSVIQCTLLFVIRFNFFSFGHMLNNKIKIRQGGRKEAGTHSWNRCPRRIKAKNFHNIMREYFCNCLSYYFDFQQVPTTSSYHNIGEIYCSRQISHNYFCVFDMDTKNLVSYT